MFPGRGDNERFQGGTILFIYIIFTGVDIVFQLFSFYFLLFSISLMFSFLYLFFFLPFSRTTIYSFQAVLPYYINFFLKSLCNSWGLPYFCLDLHTFTSRGFLTLTRNVPKTQKPWGQKVAGPDSERSRCQDSRRPPTPLTDDDHLSGLWREGGGGVWPWVSSVPSAFHFTGTVFMFYLPQLLWYKNTGKLVIDTTSIPYSRWMELTDRYYVSDHDKHSRDSKMLY